MGIKQKIPSIMPHSSNHKRIMLVIILIIIQTNIAMNNHSCKYKQKYKGIPKEFAYCVIFLEQYTNVLDLYVNIDNIVMKCNEWIKLMLTMILMCNMSRQVLNVQSSYDIMWS